MRFIHTADWHLGKYLKNRSLIEDQRYILDQFLEMVDAQKVDAVLIAGDIYDRNVPPEEAVNLFDHVLNELIIKRDLHVLCIAGNHDSEGRLNFGSRLFENTNFHIRAKLIEVVDPVALRDSFGEVYFSLIPYFDPPKVKVAFDIDTDEDFTYNDAAAVLVKAARSTIPANARSIAVSHAFIAGGVESGSEKKLPGGAGQVSPHHFNDFNYTALGHLHGATLNDKKIRYSGSLLKYSFDEWKQSKSITLVDIDGEGNIITQTLPLNPLHDVKVIKGNAVDIINNEVDSDDYISVQYEGVMMNTHNAILRKKFPNLLEIKPVDRVLAGGGNGAKSIENISHIDLFKKFFKDTTNESLSDEELAVMTDLIENIERGL